MKPALKLHEPQRVIAFNDLQAQQNKIRPDIESAIKRVLDHGIYIMGPEVRQLEEKLAEFSGAKHVISCANGTDAIGLVLMAKDVKEGDAIFVPSFTFAATAEVVAWVGATPVFIDVLPDSFNIDPESLERGIAKARELGLCPKGIIAVDLFGQPADYDKLHAIAEQHDLWIIGDAAQSFGATYKGKDVGNLCDITTTSFFPAKPLGCYGDGGAIFVNDGELASIIKSLRVHGQGTDKYDNVRIGMNGRLDTMQAAILLEKLKIFQWEVKQRQMVASQYNEALKDCVITPTVIDRATSVWAQYTIRLPEGIDRKKLMADLDECSVKTVIYYQKPMHLQQAYKHYPWADSQLKNCEKMMEDVLSLPMSAYVEAEDVQYIADCVKSCLKKQQ